MQNSDPYSEVEYMTGKDTLIALLCYRYFEIIPGQKMKVFLRPDNNSAQILNKLKSILADEKDQMDKSPVHPGLSLVPSKVR